MSKKRKNPYGIKTPTSVEEFRENLKKYYVTIPRNLDWSNGKPNRKEVPVENLYLYVQEREIPLMKLESLDDVYKITETGFYGNGSSPSICPMVTPQKELTDYMRETNQFFSSHDYFYDESNYTLWENDVDNFMENGNPLWYPLDNQWFREFYMITLGDYSGYVFGTIDEVMEKEVTM